MNSPRTALITGASGGIGAATATRLDDLGWRVLSGVRSLEAAEGLPGEPVLLDITDEGSVAAAADDVRARVGAAGLDALVNNAGVIVQGPLELVPLHALRRQFEVNVIGQVAVTQAMLPLLRAARGRIVNIGAMSGLVTVPMLGPISASKQALESITDALRMELRHQGVEVTIVEPGALETRIFEKAAEAGARDGQAGDETSRALYAKASAAFGDALAGQKPAPVDEAVKAIVKALTTGRPASRYVVGRERRQVALLRKLPERARDRLLMSNLGLTKAAFE
jgi:NAD(P)-dependent dehydrogenase (short-subunit alcohol dehydrogenase family)